MKSSTPSLSRSADHPAVIVFPPTLPLGGLVFAFILQRFLPLPAYPDWLFGELQVPVVIVLCCCGIGLMIAGGRAMKMAGTHVNPRLPARRLVMKWPFSWSRNPMYVGGNLVLLGFGVAFRLSWVGVLFPFLVAICHYGVVLPEERYLGEKFGGEYLAYKARVRRWL